MTFNFPTKSAPPPATPAVVTRRWLVKQKLRENFEKILSLPVGPLIMLQYTMAMTGKRYVWSETLGKAIPLVRMVEVRDGAGNPMRDENNELILREEHVTLSEAEHNKLMTQLLDRITPSVKAMEMEKLRDNEIDPGDEELSTQSTEALRERLKSIEGDTGASEDPEGVDPP